ncbi:MAG: class I SAM-dependent methyltransferase [Limnothrix sp. RL_2_0]|nr:class I SAM-dependent methyltransferase [Limnothrix sp. RL_2_0]
MKNFDTFFQKIYTQPLKNRRDWYAESTIAYAAHRAPYVAEMIDLVCENLPSATYENLLEVGSGPGNATQHFAKKGYRLTCVEPNTTACEFARERFRELPNAKIINSTFEEWDAPSEQFDGAIAGTSFHWLNPDIRCEKIHHLLKPNGKIVLLWNTAPQPLPEIYQHLHPLYEQYLPSFANYENLATQQRNIEKTSQSLIESNYFTDLKLHQVTAKLDYQPEDYLSLLTTLSPYIALETTIKNQFFAELRQTFQQHNIQQISTQYICAAHIARNSSF